MTTTHRFLLLLAPVSVIGLGCATSSAFDEDFAPPDRPLAYRKPNCPTTITPRPPVGNLSQADPPPTLAGGLTEGAMAVTHGGAGSPPTLADGPEDAAQRALTQMNNGTDALTASMMGTMQLEDDPRFNAGTGSNIRLDGKTIQMDAALMDSNGQFAAVAVIERVKNPIRAARFVLDSPHVMMAGEGATRFAHNMGLPDHVPTSKEAQKKYQTRMRRLAETVGVDPTVVDWRLYWNYPGDMPEDMKAWRKKGDTVGTVTRDDDGNFAASLSTGGTSVTLYGRVGDVPVYGAGLFAGPAGAVACTGKGEEIIRQGLARKVYDRIASGWSAKVAVQAAASEFPSDAAVGIIAVDRLGWGVAANRDMAYGVAATE